MKKENIFLVGIFYKNLYWAEQFIEAYLNNTKENDILRVVKNYIYKYIVDLKDGTRIALIDISSEIENDCMFDLSLCEPTIDEEEYKRIVLPITRRCN